MWHHFAGRLKDPYEWTIIKKTPGSIQYELLIVSVLFFHQPPTLGKRKPTMQMLEVYYLLMIFPYVFQVTAKTFATPTTAGMTQEEREVSLD